jgi:hypothetical protein
MFKQGQDEVLLFKVVKLLLPHHTGFQLERGALDQGGEVFVRYLFVVIHDGFQLSVKFCDSGIDFGSGIARTDNANLVSISIGVFYLLHYNLTIIVTELHRELVSLVELHCY